MPWMTAARVADLDGHDVLGVVCDGVPIVTIAPQRDLKELGVDFVRATPEGLAAAFREGVAAAETFLRSR